MVQDHEDQDDGVGCQQQDVKPVQLFQGEVKGGEVRTRHDKYIVYNVQINKI